MRPATDAVAKELLPIYDTPLLKFAIDEAVAAGARRIVLVTRPSKRGFRSYIDRIQSAPGSSLKGIEVVFAEQEEPLGLGHAVLCARDFALPGPVGVILPDDLIFGEPTLPAMCKAFAADQMQCLVAAQKVDRSSSTSANSPRRRRSCRLAIWSRSPTLRMRRRNLRSLAGMCCRNVFGLFWRGPGRARATKSS
jgi:UTP--glucose-1-phosphate uridylyltransferase